MKIQNEGENTGKSSGSGKKDGTHFYAEDRGVRLLDLKMVNPTNFLE
ncbi:MAG: hypothetical protein NHB15_05750 [Methanosarcina barkeri]|nr:hypothetical protein [Methanosarcina sp. ERenArc_MAG2]